MAASSIRVLTKTVYSIGIDNRRGRAITGLGAARGPILDDILLALFSTAQGEASIPPWTTLSLTNRLKIDGIRWIIADLRV